MNWNLKYEAVLNIGQSLRCEERSQPTIIHFTSQQQRVGVAGCETCCYSHHVVRGTCLHLVYLLPGQFKCVYMLA